MRAAANAAWNTIMLLLSKLLSRRHGGCLWGLTTKTRSRSSSCSSSLPSSLTGPPVSALVPPGVCQFGNDWIAVPLLQRFPVSHSSSVLRFALPDRTRPLQLSTCACLLANVWVTSDVGGGGGDCDATTTVPDSITRPYTPVSTNANIGHFDLLVKRYGPQARMSRHLHDTLNVGETVRFRHTDGNVKIQAPFDYDHIGMLVGGTGTVNAI